MLFDNISLPPDSPPVPSLFLSSSGVVPVLTLTMLTAAACCPSVTMRSGVHSHVEKTWSVLPPSPSLPASLSLCVFITRRPVRKADSRTTVLTAQVDDPSEPPEVTDGSVLMRRVYLFSFFSYFLFLFTLMMCQRGEFRQASHSTTI